MEAFVHGHLHAEAQKRPIPMRRSFSPCFSSSCVVFLILIPKASKVFAFHEVSRPKTLYALKVLIIEFLVCPDFENCPVEAFVETDTYSRLCARCGISE